MRIQIFYISILPVDPPSPNHISKISISFRPPTSPNVLIYYLHAPSLLLLSKAKVKSTMSPWPNRL